MRLADPPAETVVNLLTTVAERIATVRPIYRVGAVIYEERTFSGRIKLRAHHSINRSVPFLVYKGAVKVELRSRFAGVV